MKVTTFEGVVENGQVRLPDNVHLPEHLRVYVVIPETAHPDVAHLKSPRLANPGQAVDFRKEVLQETDDANL